MAAAASPPAVTQVSHPGRAIMAPPARIAAAMIPSSRFRLAGPGPGCPAGRRCAAVYPDREPVGSYRQPHRRPAGRPGPGPANRNRLLGIIAAAILAGGAMIARPGWLTWVTAGGLAAAAMTGY